MKKLSLFVSFAFVLFSTLLIPSLAFAANNDPFRGGREAVSPKQSVSVGQSSGAMTYSYPLAIPPGRNGMQPDLTLNYSSADKRQDSIFGYGWSMSLPYIERVNKIGTNNFYNQDKDHTFFTSSLSGDILPVKSTVPISGGFLATEQSTPALSMMTMPDGLSLFGDATASQAISSPRPTQEVSDEKAKSFHTFQDTFLQKHIYHPNEAEEFAAARRQAALDVKKPTPGFPVAQDELVSSKPREIIEDRTLSGKKFVIQKNGKIENHYRLFSAPVHYRDEVTGKLEDIDPRLVRSPGGFVMKKSGYNASLDTTGTGSLLSVTHDGQQISVNALNTSPVNRARAMQRGEYTLAYPDLISDGVDLEITTGDARVTEDVVIERASAVASTSGEYYDVAFTLASNRPLTLTAGDRTLGVGESLTSSSSIVLTDTEGVRTEIDAPIARDAGFGNTTRPQVIPIAVTYTKNTDGTITFVKHIPTAFLESAHYPVRTDATFLPDEGLPGINSVDGEVSVAAAGCVSTNYATVHDATDGTLLNRDGTTVIYPANGIYQGKYCLDRGILNFDTSSIGPGAIVSSSTLYMHATAYLANTDGDTMRLVANTGASNNTFTIADYDQFGTAALATADIAFSAWQTSATNTFTLNASGLAAINTTGVTKLGVRTVRDINNIAPVGGSNYAGFSSADETGTANDPMLEVITTSGITGLQVESLTNPSNIATTSPRFSALFGSGSTTAIATDYEIQVSTSSMFSTNYWDSGRLTLSSSTPTGMRTPQIFSTTTFLVDGTKYYWRTKFWDQYGTPAEWSASGDYFVMQVTGDYMAKVDDGAFVKYNYGTDGSWIAYDKRGWKYTFGATDNSRLNNPSATSTIYRWYLEEVADTRGNKMLYRYAKDGGQVYPSYVDYSDYNGTSNFEIAFASTTLTAPNSWATSSLYGFPIVTRKNITAVTAKANNNIVRRYTLGNTLGDNQSRALLSSIQETGYDQSGNNALTLPATTFGYQTSTTTWTQVTDPNAYVINFDVTDSLNNDKGYRIFDANGDGLPDWVKHDGSAQSVRFNTGNAWGSASSTWSVPVPFSASNIEQGVRTADVNGDGLIDIIAASSTKAVYLNNGMTGFTASTSWAFPQSFIDTSNRDLGVQIVDLNGDGLADVFRSYYATTTGTSSAVYMNTGYTWTQDTGWSIPEVLINNLRDAAVRLYDYNGDGLPDIVYSPSPYGSTSPRSYYNTGRGWELDNGVTVPLDFASTTASIGTADQGVRFADFNGDGCVDIAKGHASSTAVVRMSNCASGWNVAASSTLSEYFRDSVSDYGVRMDDMNGDGQLDLVRGYYDSASATSTRKVYIKNGDVPDILKYVINTKGGKTTVGYQSSARYFDTSGNLANLNVPFVVQTARTITTDSGSFLSGAARVIATTTYDYQRGYYYASSADSYSRQFAGFGLVIEAKPNGAGTKTYFHQGNSSDTTNGEYVDHISKAGRAYRIETLDGTTTSANLYARTINKWRRADYGDGRNFVKLENTLSQIFDGDLTHRDTAASSTYDDMTGNLSEVVSLGEVLGNSDGTWTDTGSDNATTTLSYAASSTLSAMSLPSREFVVDQSGTTVKDTKWYYDSLASGLVSYGNQTKEEKLISGSTYASTTRIYNAYGNVATSTDPLGHTTAFIYDAYNLFPTIIVNALGYTKLISYDYSSGKAATTTDENSQTFVTVFDNLGRPVLEKQPDFVTPSTLVTKTTYTYTDSTTTPPSVFRQDYLNAATTTDAYAYTDGFGRTIQSKKEAESANGWITSDTIYSVIGAVASNTLPYFSTTASFATPTTTSALFIHNYYDPMGRVITLADAVGTTTTTYSDWKVRVTDPLSVNKDYWKDAYGNLSDVVEYPTAASPATTTYAWNRLGKLIALTDASSSLRTFTYDNLGRITKSEDLHLSGDTTYGSTTYSYDAAGNITTKLTPNSQTINFTYDALNRQLTEDYTGAVGTEVTYTYDTCTNGIMRLCQSVNQGSATTTYNYNPIGFASSTGKQIGTTWATTTTIYLRNGLTDILTYPNNQKITFIYNDAGDLNRVLSLPPASTTWKSIIESVTYAPTGAPLIVDYGNNTQTTYTYDAAAKYRLTRKYTVSTSTISGTPEQLFLESAIALDALPLLGVDPAPEPRQITVEGKTATEDIAARTPQSKKFTMQNDDGQTVTIHHLYTAPVHYKNPKNGYEEDIDPSLVQTVSGFTMQKAEYKTSLDLLGENPLVTLTNNGRTLTLDSSVADRTELLRATKTGDYTATYPDLLGTSRDMEIITGDHTLTENVVLRDASVLTAITGDTLDIPFTLAAPSALTLTVEGKILTEGSPIMSSSSPVLITDTDGNFIARILPPVAVDTAVGTAKPQIIPITITYTKNVDGSIILTKHIPLVFLSAATYPVRSDATFDFRPDEDLPGTNSVDGEVSYAGAGCASTNYATVHDATDGNAINRDGTNVIYAGNGIYQGKYCIDRDILNFDTSSIGAGMTVSSSTLYLHATAYVANTDSDSMRLVANTGASNNTFTTADYDQFGTTALATGDIAFSAWQTSATNTFTLNATGLAAINTTGVTKLGMRTVKDITNTAPGGGSNYAGFSSADETGIYSDPMLEVIATPYATPTPMIIPSTTLQDLRYTYDAAGNITQIIDLSGTKGQATTTYTYDNLYRLIIASSSNATSTTAGTSQDWFQTYSYDNLGNITYKSDVGSYAYTSISYANPHAVTSISTSSGGTSTIWVLVVAGGGAGGSEGQGGGAGGVLENTAYSIMPGTPYTITVGAGGTTTNVQGTASTFSTLNAVGGGSGNVWNGGSGIGDSPFNGANYGLGTTGQGHNGGVASDASVYGSGGGGGCNTTGDNGSSAAGGNGGNGCISTITGTSTTYGGGGGAGTCCSGTGTAGTGGTGGGGNAGAPAQNGTNGLGGGGGGPMRTSVSAAGTGGNGVVILRYTTANHPNTSCLGTLTTIGADSICTFNIVDSGKTIIFPSSDGTQTNFTYDQAGNVTSRANGLSTSTYTYDYRNRLTDANVNGTSTHYLYDAADQRVQQDIKIGASATSTTKYFNRYYEVTSSGSNATTTMYVFALGQLVATIEGNGTATTTNITHTDHQNSTNVVSSDTGALKQLVNVYPYGSMRINQQPTSGFNTKRKYIGEYQDDAVALSYLNARYYDGRNGKFLSQDPVAREIGMMANMIGYILRVNQTPGEYTQTALLLNPQMLNSYSYSVNNPISSSDPSGLMTIPGGRVEWGDTAVSIANQLNGVYGLQYGAYFTGDSLLAYNGGKQPVLGGYYSYSIDLGSRACGGCSGGTGSNGGGGTYYPPVSSPGVPSAFATPEIAQNGGRGTYAQSTPGMNMYQSCGIAVSACSHYVNTAKVAVPVAILFGGYMALPATAPAWLSGLRPLAGILPEITDDILLNSKISSAYGLPAIIEKTVVGIVTGASIVTIIDYLLDPRLASE